MLSCYIREQYGYTADELFAVFKHCNSIGKEISKEYIIRLWHELAKYGLTRIVRKKALGKDLSELSTEDVIMSQNISDDSDYRYVCAFVGIIVIDGIVLKCYPKYIASTNSPLEEMCQVIKVLNKYYNRSQTVFFNSALDSENEQYNLLSVMLSLMYDYYQYGLYTKEQVINERNGRGEILWDKTVDNEIAVISNGRPFYPDIISKKRLNDEESFVRKVHAWVISDCSKRLEKADLLKIFALEPVDVEQQDICELGDSEYIIYRLKQEQSVQFNTRKIHLLELLETYLNKECQWNKEMGFSLYGSTSFNLIWQNVCSEVFGDVINTRLVDLPLGIKEPYTKLSYKTMKEIMPHPLWTVTDNNGEYHSTFGKGTLESDIIVLNSKKDFWQLVVYDAKYYLLDMNSDGFLSGNPGVGDVTKQYLYALFYKKFAVQNGIKELCNAFLFPAEKLACGAEKVGKVTFSIFDDLKLDPVVLYKIDAVNLFDLYLHGRKMVLNDF